MLSANFPEGLRLLLVGLDLCSFEVYSPKKYKGRKVSVKTH